MTPTTIAILITAAGLLLSLLVTAGGGLAVIWKVASLTGRTLSAIERFEKRSEKWDGIADRYPVLEQRVGTLETTVTSQLRDIRSDLPPRGELDSISNELEDLKQLRELVPRVRVIEDRMGLSNRSLGATRDQVVPRPGGRRDDR